MIYWLLLSSPSGYSLSPILYNISLFPALYFSQLLSNKYLSQSVADLENQAAILERQVNDLANHCKGIIKKYTTRLMEIRVKFIFFFEIR